MKKITRIKRPIFTFGKIFGAGLALAMLWAALVVPLAAQAPTDEWRRGGMDAMVAEPGGASSILANPAGIKTQEERPHIFNKKDKPGKKHEWITEIVSADLFVTADTWALIENPDIAGDNVSLEFDDFTRTSELFDEEKESNKETVKLIQSLSNPIYEKLIQGTDLPPNPNDLTLDALQNTDRKRLADNVEATEDLTDALNEGAIDALTDLFIKRFSNSLGNLGVEHFSRTLSVSHVNDKRPLAWGFYLGLEQKILVRTNVPSMSMPVTLKIGSMKANLNLPIALQAYVLAPLRLAFAHNFGEALPGFTFGLGFKTVPYLGVNQEAIGRFITDSVGGESTDDAFGSVIAGLSTFSGINIGLDFGVQYHFGAILPQLEFLHTGLKISDLIGFNIPFSDKYSKLRYALDFDWGVYAEYQFPKILQLFGGAEFIQLRGLFPGGASPYSALIDPIDHLRLLAGIALFDNVLRFSAQFYNNTFTPAIMLNVGPFQFQAGFNLNVKSAGSWGLEVGLRFRAPHNGFNKRTPYKTYAKPAAKRKWRRATR